MTYNFCKKKYNMKLKTNLQTFFKKKKKNQMGNVVIPYSHLFAYTFLYRYVSRFRITIYNVLYQEIAISMVTANDVIIRQSAV